MERVPEPELMDSDEQARAYATADFEQPHNMFVQRFTAAFPGERVTGRVLDLGCGPADITIRFARAYPECVVDGIDGAEAMLRYGRAAVSGAGLAARIRLIQARLPGGRPPHDDYCAVISNSLLHHLDDPLVLWHAVAAHAARGAPVFIMDLLRPPSRERAERLKQKYAAGEPEVLQQDFFNSLLAAYTADEVREQLGVAGLGQLQVEVISDRHLTVSGRA